MKVVRCDAESRRCRLLTSHRDLFASCAAQIKRGIPRFLKAGTAQLRVSNLEERRNAPRSV